MEMGWFREGFASLASSTWMGSASMKRLTSCPGGSPRLDEAQEPTLDRLASLAEPVSQLAREGVRRHTDFWGVARPKACPHRRYGHPNTIWDY